MRSVSAVSYTHLEEEKAAEEAKRLETYKNSLSKEELEAIVADTAALKAYQDEPSPQEELERIPMLKLSDIEREPAKLYIDKKSIAAVSYTHLKCGGKGKIAYTQQSILGMVRNVQPCPDCHGTGKIIKEKCPDCYGTGYISTKKTIEVTIPAGIDNGQCVRIQGKGEPGTNGGARGDLLVAVMIAAEPGFERDGYNIFSNVTISYPTAVLGGEVKVKTVDGEVLYEVKPGTASGTRVRLRGKGMPTLRNKNVRGDHYITLVVDIPTKLTNEQKEALAVYDKLLTGDCLLYTSRCV